MSGGGEGPREVFISGVDQAWVGQCMMLRRAAGRGAKEPGKQAMGVKNCSRKRAGRVLVGQGGRSRTTLHGASGGARFVVNSPEDF